MEPDRFQKNHTIFIMGMVALIAALSLFALSFFIMPSILLGWVYDTPAFIPNWVEILRNNYHYTNASAAKLVLLFLFLSAIFFSFIAYFCSNYIDNHIYSEELQVNAKSVKVKTRFMGDELRLIITLLLCILLVIGVVQFFAWLIKNDRTVSTSNQEVISANYH